MLSIHTMEHCSTIKGTEVLIHATVWTELETIKQRVRHKRPHIVLLHLHEVSRINKSIVIESRLVVARSWEEGGIGSDRY